MRIGSGALRGRKLVAPHGTKTRPTSGRLKKSLFDVLASRLEGARVLDLYAGAGSLGIEALSRGAAHAVLVERRRAAAEAIRRNIEELGLLDRAEVIRKDVLSTLSRLSGRFDVVFADPPYRSMEPEKLLRFLGRGTILSDSAFVVLEHHHKRELPDRIGNLVSQRMIRAGESCFTLFALTE
ncbi:MAG TPA: 16S rRNA (guanine(966)-N(2))-methyltransferase RsmD [Vicinamibacteria bacterium]|nr:16S rRNA (guanine(966)-N(2))-methyltransferase RsmD [Vicinamibacteria bacterium]